MPKTFEFQDKLPRLPIPPLDHTSKVYLQSCEPYYASVAERNEHIGIVSDFFKAGGLGAKLQERLLIHDKTKLSGSWLEDWWLKYAYLSWRNSLLIHSNWFVLAGPIEGIEPIISFEEGWGKIQVERAAGFASSFLDYKDKLDRGEIVPETTKQGPLDMHQYSRMFGITRVPKPDCDILVGSHPASAQHIIVMVKDQIFIVYLYDRKTGGRIPVKEVERQFWDCIAIVQSGDALQPPIGLLSGQHRDKWAEHHGHLLTLGQRNSDSFNMIESSLFSVCLDHRIVPDGVTDLARNVFHGFNGHNRWFDKSLSIVVTNCGRLGVHGEHSPCDALVPAMLVDFATKRFLHF